MFEDVQPEQLIFGAIHKSPGIGDGNGAGKQRYDYREQHKLRAYRPRPEFTFVQHSAKILVVMSDLFFSVKIIDAAKRLGMTAEFVKDKGIALEKAKAGPAVAVIDLNCDAADPLDLIAIIKAETNVPMLGFVSHVQTDLKQRAVDAGCDTVVARSIFAQRLPELLSIALQSRATG